MQLVRMTLFSAKADGVVLDAASFGRGAAWIQSDAALCVLFIAIVACLDAE